MRRNSRVWLPRLDVHATYSPLRAAVGSNAPDRFPCAAVVVDPCG